MIAGCRVVTEQKTVEVKQLQCSDKVVDVLVESRRGAAGAVPAVMDVPVNMQGRWVSRTVKVPQTQFIAGVAGHSSSQQRRARFQRGMAAMRVVLVFFRPFFALLQVGWS